MGMTPAKYFPQPTPYGATPQQGAVGSASLVDPAPTAAPVTPTDTTQLPTKLKLPYQTLGVTQ
jgi:hypothetical protein